MTCETFGSGSELVNLLKDYFFWSFEEFNLSSAVFLIILRMNFLVSPVLPKKSREKRYVTYVPASCIEENNVHALSFGTVEECQVVDQRQ